MIFFNKDVLFDTNTPVNYCFSQFKEELEELIVTLNRQLASPHGIFAYYVTLLPSYLSSMYVYNSACFVRRILEEIIIDPFDVSYIEYAGKIEALASSFYDWMREEEKEEEEEVYPHDDFEYERFDPYLNEFGENLEDLFGAIEPEPWEPETKGRWVIMAGDIEIGSSDRIRRPEKTILPKDNIGKLSSTTEILIENRRYLVASIWTCLEDLAKLLREIRELLCDRSKKFEAQEDLFLRRRNDYLNSGHGEIALEELYNDIAMLSGVVDEYQLLSNIKVQIYFRLRNNVLGQRYLINKDYFIDGLFNSHSNKVSQTTLNEFLKINCQYRHICKLINYHSKWSLTDSKSIFLNSGIDCIVNTLVPYLSSKIKFESRKSYAALWQALIDLNMLKRLDASSFKDWVNDSFLKDAPNDSSKKGKMKNDKSVRGAVDDMYKFQTKDAKQKQFKDLTEEEIAKLKNGVLLKELYQDCILILSKAFDIDLKGKGFQPYITEYSEAKDFLSDFPEDSKSAEIMECFSAYEDFSKRQIVKKR